MKHTILGAVVGLALSVVAATCHQGCTPYPHAAYTSQDQIDADYKAEMKHCVDVAKTKQEALDCQELVRWKYGVCEVPSAGDPTVPTYAPCPRED